MGLDTTHGAFHGAYSSFNRFRQAVTRTMCGSWPPHNDLSLDPERWYFDDERMNRESHPGLFVLMEHSDCDGEISPGDCFLVANDLDALADDMEREGLGVGHTRRDGGYAEVARQFARGCRAAARASEPLEFR